jgi:hypothetical protein
MSHGTLPVVPFFLRPSNSVVWMDYIVYSPLVGSLSVCVIQILLEKVICAHKFLKIQIALRASNEKTVFPPQ